MATNHLSSLQVHKSGTEACCPAGHVSGREAERHLVSPLDQDANGGKAAASALPITCGDAEAPMR